MAKLPNSAEGIKAEIKRLKSLGKTESTSKEVGKLVNALKILEPNKYDAKQVAAAKTSLQSNTTPETKANLGLSTPGGSSSGGSLGLSGGGTSGVNLMDTYNEALSGVSDLQKELDAKKAARDAALADVNDNPFYTEATRVGKQAKVNEASVNDINTIESQIAQKKADAQVAVNIRTQQYNIDDKNYQNNLQKLNTLISTGAIVNATSSDIAQIAQATGMSTNMVQSVIAKAKSDQVKPQVITSTDDNGKVTVSVVDGVTGRVISQNSLGNVAGTKTTKDTTPTPDTNKYLTKAISILKEVDIENYGTADKLLSSWEADDAYNRILALVGNDTAMADSVFKQAIKSGGYNSWGQ